MRTRRMSSKITYPRRSDQNCHYSWHVLFLLVSDISDGLFYKTDDNIVLTFTRLNLQEECDMLSVRAAQDAATIHELQMCLELEREGTDW